MRRTLLNRASSVVGPRHGPHVGGAVSPNRLLEVILRGCAPAAVRMDRIADREEWKKIFPLLSPVSRDSAVHAFSWRRIEIHPQKPGAPESPCFLRRHRVESHSGEDKGWGMF